MLLFKLVRLLFELERLRGGGARRDGERGRAIPVLTLAAIADEEDKRPMPAVGMTGKVALLPSPNPAVLLLPPPPALFPY
jgi:hypothetical protein